MRKLVFAEQINGKELTGLVDISKNPPELYILCDKERAMKILKRIKEVANPEEVEYTLEDIMAAVQYGFDYRTKAQNDGIKVPSGNVLQWLMARKELISVPKEFDEYQQKEKITMANKR